MIKENLLEELDVMSKIILNAKASFDVVIYFNDENDKKSALINFELVRSDFFRFVEMNFFRITIIELFKLFSFNNEDYYSFYSLKNRFGPGKKYESLNISTNTLKDIGTLTKQSKAIIEKLRNLRNKAYAHSDQEYKKYLGVLDIQEINKLIGISKNIFNKFYGEIAQRELLFDFPLGTPLDSLQHLFEKIEFFNDNYENVIMQNIQWNGQE